MSKRKKKNRNPKSSSSVAKSLNDSHEGSRLRMLIALVALITAQVLLPADAAAAGQGAALPMVMLSWVLFCAWLLVVRRNEKWPLRFGRCDALVALLLAWHTLSAIVAVSNSDGARMAINMHWQWLGLGLLFFLTRQLVQTQREVRAIVVVLISLSVCHAVHGYYQMAVEIPASRADFESQERLGENSLGIVDPLEKALYKERLYSPEPYSTFSLTNSLAGVLAIGLMLAVGVVAAVWRQRKTFLLALSGVLLSGIVIAVCLFLTHSRSAVLAALLGTCLLGLLWLTESRFRSKRRTLLVISILLVLTVGGVFGVMATESEAAAATSLRYRLEYWQATWSMMLESPWFGCGPGNFQTYYTHFMLPQASETVADPHNFLLEVGATAGLPALLCLVALLGCFAIKVSRPEVASAKSFSKASKKNDLSLSLGPVAVLLGGVMGCLIAWILGLLLAPMLVVTLEGWKLLLALLIGAGIWSLLRNWIDQGTLPKAILPIAVLVMLIHLLAAGGIGYAGVAVGLWVVMTLALNGSDATPISRPVRSVWLTAGLLMAVATAAMCLLTAYQPVDGSRSVLASAERAHGKRSGAEVLELYTEAARADPLSFPAAQGLARIRFDLWYAEPTEPKWKDFQLALSRMLALVPSSSAAYRQSGDWHMVAYRLQSDRERLQAAAQAYQAAVDRYGTSNMLRAELAWAWHLLGDEVSSRREAAEALRLDKLHPHPRQKLNSPLRQIADPEVRNRLPSELMQQILAVSEN